MNSIRTLTLFNIRPVWRPFPSPFRLTFIGWWRSHVTFHLGLHLIFYLFIIISVIVLTIRSLSFSKLRTAINWYYKLSFEPSLCRLVHTKTFVAKNELQEKQKANAQMSYKVRMWQVVHDDRRLTLNCKTGTNLTVTQCHFWPQKKTFHHDG